MTIDEQVKALIAYREQHGGDDISPEQPAVLLTDLKRLTNFSLTASEITEILELQIPMDVDVPWGWTQLRIFLESVVHKQ